jgi:uncharacterized alkaline shock family protein YloU
VTAGPVDLEGVASSATACPSIAGLSGGRFGEVATYLPGRRIVGIRQVDGVVEVHVVARWGTPLPEVAELVRAAVAPAAGGVTVSVFVDDIEVPADPAAAAREELSRARA